MISFGANPLGTNILYGLDLTDEMIPVPVLVAFGITEIDVPSTIEIRVLDRSMPGNMDSPSLFTLSTFISSQKDVNFEAQGMLLVQWMEDTINVSTFSSNHSH